jgi:glyoxylase-like metal-dependent hydrolase (beta-lactamase superfamily II)
MSDDLTATFPRRQILAQAACLGAGYSLASAFPFPALSSSLRDDPRISQTPIVDAGFAAVRKIADGVYATISDPSKGFSTMCNGGFLFGKDAALLVEGFVTAAGAAFQMDALRKVSQAPAAGALNTHYHYDHSLGNGFYSANGIQLWGHAVLPQRMIESYGAMQATDRSTFLAPFEKRVNNAKSEVQKHMPTVI